MATRKQRALKLARRRDAQARHRGIRIEDYGHSRIQVPVGSKPTPSFHRSDPYEHGEELRRREQIVSFCAAIGFEPTDEQIKMMREMMGQGRLTRDVVRNMASRDANERILRRSIPSGGPHAPRMHVDEVELMQVDEIDGLSPEMEAEAGSLMTHEELEQDAWDAAAYEQRMGWPTPAQWADLETAAKAKKKGAKGYVRVLEEAGFVLGKNEDPRDRKSWTRA